MATPHVPAFSAAPVAPAVEGSGAAGATGEAARIKAQATRAAVQFEAYFIRQMLAQVRQAGRSLGAPEGGAAQRTGHELLELADGLVADTLAAQRAFGIADLMLRQLLPDLSAAPGRSPSGDDAARAEEESP